jgi:hypothetical protein
MKHIDVVIHHHHTSALSLSKPSPEIHRAIGVGVATVSETATPP